MGGSKGSRVIGIILAAGASRRMGRPKLLLPLDGKPLLQHAIDAAAASRLDGLIVVLGDRAEEVGAAIELPEGAREVVNERFAEGQSTSLRLGLRSAGEDIGSAAVLLGDQPGVGAALIDRVLAAFEAGDRPVARPVYTVGERRVPGHPVVLSREVWAEVEAVEGDRGAQRLLASRGDWLLEVAAEGAPPADVDTPEDYEKAAGKPARQ